MDVLFLLLLVLDETADPLFMESEDALLLRKGLMDMLKNPGNNIRFFWLLSMFLEDGKIFVEEEETKRLIQTLADGLSYILNRGGIIVLLMFLISLQSSFKRISKLDEGLTKPLRDVFINLQKSPDRNQIRDLFGNV